MHKPIDNFVLADYPNGSVTQWFGENKELYARWGLNGHNGIDIVAPHGSPMYAVEDAYVVDVKLDPNGFGKHLRLRSTQTYDGFYHEWVYGHCSAIRVTLGKFVEAGKHIADMGNTGFVVSGSNPWWEYNPYAGTHLHLGLRLLEQDEKNGWKYPGDTIRYRIVNYNNGLKGAINPRSILADSEQDAKRAQLLTIVSLLNTVVGLLKKKLSTTSNREHTL